MLTKKFKKELLAGRHPIMVRGPRGGGGSFSFGYPKGGGCTVADRSMSEECAEFLRSNGVEVKEYRNKGEETFLHILADLGI